MAGEVKKLDVAAATIKQVVAPKLSKVQSPVAKSTPAVAGDSTYQEADVTAKQVAQVPTAPLGGAQARAAALINKGKAQINSPEALLAKLDGMTDMAAAEFLGKEFADSIKGIS